MAPDGAKIPEFKFVGTPLSRENTETLLMLIVSSMEGKEGTLEDDDTLKDLFLAQIAIKRVAAYRLPFKVTNFFFMASLMTFMNSPGMVMGMLWIAKCYADRCEKDVLTVQDWCEMFPSGAPTPEECEQWWDSQKVTWEKEPLESDNTVDYPELWGCKVEPTQKETFV